MLSDIAEFVVQGITVEGEIFEPADWPARLCATLPETSPDGKRDYTQFIKPDVSTMCIGQAASMGAVLLAGGTKGKRFILPNARHMIHQPLGGASGQATDVEIQARELLRWKKVLTNIYVDTTGKTYEELQQDMERDFFMTAEESVAYGLADKILTTRA